MQDKTDLALVKLLSTEEWQKKYKNFVYQNATYFQEGGQEDIQRELFQKFQNLMNPIMLKYLDNDQIVGHKEVISILCQKLKTSLKENPDIIQVLSLCDFKIFKAEMLLQNQMLDLVALELIRKEQSTNDSDDDDDDEEEYFEQERLQAKYNIENIKKKELEKSIKDTIIELNLPAFQQQIEPQQKVDQFGFQVGIVEKEDDSLKKTMKARTLRLKAAVPKQEIKVTTELLKKRRLQAEAIKEALKEI